MGAIWDIIKNIPHVGVLKEKIDDRNATITSLKTERDKLTIDLHTASAKLLAADKEIEELKAQHVTLQDRIDELSGPPKSLEPCAARIMELFREHDETAINFDLVKNLGFERIQCRYAVDQLEALQYLKQMPGAANVGYGTWLVLDPSGKKYVLDTQVSDSLRPESSG